MIGRASALVLVVLVTAGCRGCHEDHPYVPYAIDSAGGSQAGLDGAGGVPVASAATVDASPARFVGEPATLAPPGTTRWPLDDVVLDAPEGTVFVAAAVRDYDADGAKDAFAIVRASDADDPGKAVYFAGRPGAEALRSSADFVPPAGLSRDPACGLVDRLVVVSQRSVLVELGAACPARSAQAPDRWFAVISGGAPARVRLAATIADPAGAPALSVDADTVDRDGDGREDLALAVSLEGGGAPFEPGPRVGATLAWLDRPAGLSRDLSATEASFSSLAATAAARAARAKDAPAVPGFVAQVRALYRAVCADGGAPRLQGVAGTGAMSCGAGRALEQAGLAEVRAYAAGGDPLRAALAFDRAVRPPATKTAAREAEAQAWIGQIAPPAVARGIRAVAAVPILARGHEPTWGSLAFDAGGKLLVRTRAGVVRVDPDAGDESAADGVADWKPGVRSPDGAMRWIETYDPCDGLPVQATFTSAQGDDLRDVALPVLPPLGDRCAGSRGAPAHTLPLAWGPAGLEAIVEGEPVLVSPDLARAAPLAALLGQPFNPGAPRSPDGTALAVPTGAGIVVKHGARARLFRATELDGTYGELQDCAVSNDAAHVACVRGTKAWVGSWEPF